MRLVLALGRVAAIVAGLAVLAGPGQRLAAAGEPVAVTERQRAMDDLRRQDAAAGLAFMGVNVKWQAHTLAELTDWRARVEAAYALRSQFAVDVDWRATSLRALTDMRLRAAKASELIGVYGVAVDWRRYTWADLVRLENELARLSPDATARARTGANQDDDRLAIPGTVGTRRRNGRTPRDPDAIIEPTFAFDTPIVWARPVGHHGPADPDAILVPTFVTVPRPTTGGDDLLDPWRHPRPPRDTY